MDIKVSTTHVTVKTVGLSLSRLRQLDVVSGYDKEFIEKLTLIGRISPVALGPELGHQFSQDVVLVERGGVSALWGNGSTSLPQDVYNKLPKIIV